MNLFQSPEWEAFKLKTGYQKSYRVDDVLVLQKELPMGRSMLYSPMIGTGQLIPTQNKDFISQIRKIGADNNSIFYRLEIDVAQLDGLARHLRKAGYKKCFEEMQPEHTLILDISPSEEQILAQMKPKGRYNIKVAQKHKVNIVKEQSIDSFYELYRIMAKRQKITYRSHKYYQNLFDIYHEKDYIEVFTAFEENDSENPLASAIILYCGDRATYLFGGSSEEHRNLKAPNLVQWTAIQSARARGCKEYDFFGIAPDDNPRHPWAGVTRFKKQFGGEQVDLLGSWDLVLKPIEYQVFKIAEKIRRR